MQPELHTTISQDTLTYQSRLLKLVWHSLHCRHGCMAIIYRGGACSHSMIRMMRQACACVHIRRLTKRASTHLSEQVREQFAFAHAQQMVLALRDHAWMARSARSSRRSPVSTTSEMKMTADDCQCWITHMKIWHRPAITVTSEGRKKK